MKISLGLERWLRGKELYQRSWVLFPAPTWQLTPSITLVLGDLTPVGFCGHQAYYVRRKHTCKQNTYSQSKYQVAKVKRFS